jgi:hypothetical protein
MQHQKKKKTNATKKYYWLQQLNKPTAIELVQTLATPRPLDPDLEEDERSIQRRRRQRAQM